MNDVPEFGGPHICPVCAAVKAADDWPTHARFGFRVCPHCLHQGLGSVIPVQWSEEAESCIRTDIRDAELRIRERLQ